MIVGKKEQAKGRRAEIELSRILNEHGLHTRPGKAVSFGCEADVVGLDGVHIEVKRRECPNIADALTQAKADADFFADGLPVVFTRGNRQKWRAVMDLEVFVRLYRGEVGHDGGNEDNTGREETHS